MLGNILVKYFEAGGPIMWPILIIAIVAVAVVGERTFWWWRESLRRDPETLEKVFVELQKAGRFLTVMDTLVTLAPLLGLLGTVSGIFRTFLSLGGATVEGATSQITGGIGEALIATMCGLAIAIIALIPFNFFTRKLAQLQFELESAATNVEVMVTAAKQKGFDTMEFRREDAQRPA